MQSEPTKHVPADWVPDVKPGDPLPVPCEGTPEQCTRSHTKSASSGGQGSASGGSASQAPAPVFPGKHGEFIPNIKPGDQLPVPCEGSPEACTRSHTKDKELHTIAFVLENDPRFSIVRKALHQVGAIEELKSAGPFTLFGGVDNAYLPPRMPDDQAVEFQERVATLDFLSNHLVRGKKLKVADLKHIRKIDLHGVKGVPVTHHGDSIKIGHSQIEFPDIECANGVIHGMSHVLEPREMRKMLGEKQQDVM